MLNAFQSLALCAIFSLGAATAAQSKGADITICNETAEDVHVVKVYQRLYSGAELTWAETGWDKVDANSCSSVLSITIGWAAFAFAAGDETNFRSFTFTPSDTFNRSGQTSPTFSSVCVIDYPGRFARYELTAREIGTTCAPGATQAIPVSFKILADAFTNVKLTVTIDQIPSTGNVRLGRAESARAFKILGEVGGCQIVAAPSLLAAKIVVDGAQLPLSAFYDQYLAKAKKAITKYDRNFTCGEIKSLKGQFYPFIKDDTGNIYQIFLHDKDSGVEPDSSGRGFRTPESNQVYRPEMSVMGIKKL